TQGRLVYQEVASPGHEAIKVEGLARGLYIVKGRVGNEVYVGKFVKE
ncbi:MAG: T9SS type A sorting domain-containing protein, partial [Phaeodactylibacter sp.]|nr:T9SS type A sorting domain-containing protein [Phaeodactylibacter sp.]